MIWWWFDDDLMMIWWWFDDDLMMIWWWFDDDLMMIWWWFDDDLMMIWWWWWWWWWRLQWASCSKLTASFFDKPALPRREQHSKQRTAASAGPGQLFRRQMQTACSQQYFSTTLPLRCTRLGTQAAYPISIAERAHVCKIAAVHWSPPLGHTCSLVSRVDGPDTEVKTGPQKGRSPSKPNNTCTHGHDMCWEQHEHDTCLNMLYNISTPDPNRPALLSPPLLMVSAKTPSLSHGNANLNPANSGTDMLSASGAASSSFGTSASGGPGCSSSTKPSPSERRASKTKCWVDVDGSKAGASSSFLSYITTDSATTPSWFDALRPPVTRQMSFEVLRGHVEKWKRQRDLNKAISLRVWARNPRSAGITSLTSLFRLIWVVSRCRACRAAFPSTSLIRIGSLKGCRVPRWSPQGNPKIVRWRMTSKTRADPFGNCLQHTLCASTITKACELDWVKRWARGSSVPARQSRILSQISTTPQRPRAAAWHKRIRRRQDSCIRKASDDVVVIRCPAVA